MKRNYVNVLMNPVRLRIVQYLILHKKGTTTEIKEELSDIPIASLYRHIKALLDAECIYVLEERKVRGVVERTYALEEEKIKGCGSNQQGELIQSALFSIMSSFSKYFNGKDPNPERDLLMIATSSLLLSDQEYMDMMEQIGAIITAAMENKVSPERKPRQITLISSPNKGR